MMSAHDRKALLRAAYGLLVLWVINGFFGLLRVAGPGAALPYIEIGLLIGYWAWVFFWWQTNRLKPNRSAARKSQVRQAREAVDEDVSRAVDLEEAVARERNRRRKAQLQRAVGKVGSQVGSGLNQVRYVIAGLLVVVIAVFGYQAYETNRRQEAARVEQQTYKNQTAEAMSIWYSRNRCVAAEWKQRWRVWYSENPETQTINVFNQDVNSPNFGIYQVTKKLPLPETIDKVRWGGTASNSTREPVEWFVSQQHFKSFEIMISYECELKYPPPEGLSESDIDEDSMGVRISTAGLTPANFSPSESLTFSRRYRWQDPFELLGSNP
jgi:hypothetical protein